MICSLLYGLCWSYLDAELDLLSTTRGYLFAMESAQITVGRKLIITYLQYQAVQPVMFACVQSWFDPRPNALGFRGLAATTRLSGASMTNWSSHRAHSHLGYT